MNKVILIGRLVKDPDVRMGTNNTTIARYTLAVERQYRKNNERTSDFINCVALGKNGEFAEKYLHKGIKIAVIGTWQTGNYTDKDGKKSTQMIALWKHMSLRKAKRASQKNNRNHQFQVQNKTQVDSWICRQLWMTNFRLIKE